MFSPGPDGRIRNCCPEPKLRKSSYGTAPFTLINDFFSFWCTQSAFLILCFPVVKSKLVLWIQIRYLDIGSGSRSSTGLVSVFCEFMSKILHLLPLFYPIFTCVDPIRMQIRIRNTDTKKTSIVSLERGKGSKNL